MLGAQFCRKSKNPTLSMDCKFFFLIGCQEEHCGEGWLRAALQQAASLFMSPRELFGFGDTKTAFPGQMLQIRASGRRPRVCTARSPQDPGWRPPERPRRGGSA